MEQNIGNSIMQHALSVLPFHPVVGLVIEPVDEPVTQ